MRKLFFVIWILDTAALAWLFGYILLHGSTPDRTDLAGDLGAIWGGLAAIGGWTLISSKWKARKQDEKAKGAAKS